MTNSSAKKQIGLAVAYALAAAVMATTLGCSPAPSAVAAVIKDKVYTVNPASVKVTAGIVTGEITEMKVTERVEEGSGRIANPQSREAHRETRPEKRLRGPDCPPGRGQDHLHRYPGQGHQARGEPYRTDHQGRLSVWFVRAARSGPGCDSSCGCGVSGRGLEGEEAEGNPPRAYVHPVAVQGTETELHRVDRRSVDRPDCRRYARTGESCSRRFFLAANSERPPINR